MTERAKGPDLEGLLAEHAARERAADEAGGPARVARQRRLGRWLARERVTAFGDPGSFVELERHALHAYVGASERLASQRAPGDGVVCGTVAVRGRTVGVIAHDVTVLRGAVGEVGGRKMARLLDLAGARGFPVVTFAESDGARVDEGVRAIEAYGEVIRRTVVLQRRVTQLTVASGVCVGAAAYAAALGDWVAMLEGRSWMLITGPRVTKVATGEDVDLDALGGVDTHATRTGQCHGIVGSEEEGVAWARRLLAYVHEPSSTFASADHGAAPDDPRRAVPELERLVPVAERRVYDMRPVVETVFDRGSLLELTPRYARNLLTLLGRLGGVPVAVVASQPKVLGGALDIDASLKGERFVRWAGRRGLPVVTLADVPGYLPGTTQERGGILPHGARLVEAYGDAPVPKVCLVLRKAYGAASLLPLASDVRLALPTARVAPMGPSATFEVTMGPEPEGASSEALAARAESKARWLAENDHVWGPAETGFFDRVVRFDEARAALASALFTVLGRPLPRVDER